LKMFEHWTDAARAGRHYRDGEYYTGERYFIEADPKTSGVNPAARLKSIQDANIPSYTFGGWFDSFSYDAAAWYMNMSGPHKLILGPWGHAEGVSDAAFQESRRFERIEALRWMDYWLKGVDNGVLDEPPVHYAITTADDAWTWASAAHWPPEAARAHDFYLVNANDAGGRLTTERPGAHEPADARIQFDRTATTSQRSRWYGAMGIPVAYPDMAENDHKGLVYETPPLTEPLSIAGSPVVEMRVSSTAADADILVHLHDVDEHGVSRHLVEGVLRASYRAEGPAPYKTPGGVYHPATKAAVESAPALNAGVATLRIAFLPIAAKFQAGHRIRLVIHGADVDNLDTLALEPAPTVTIASTTGAPSKLTLPVLPWPDERIVNLTLKSERSEWER
ncbi:MAG: CocE/NonD family hydrolase, partial [Caulobacterales bacterium]|nr:CocE/NonD family hydrolase [Caulobacterales bacterium]